MINPKHFTDGRSTVDCFVINAATLQAAYSLGDGKVVVGSSDVANVACELVAEFPQPPTQLVWGESRGVPALGCLISGKVLKLFCRRAADIWTETDAVDIAEGVRLEFSSKNELAVACFGGRVQVFKQTGDVWNVKWLDERETTRMSKRERAAHISWSDSGSLLAVADTQLRLYDASRSGYSEVLRTPLRGPAQAVACAPTCARSFLLLAVAVGASEDSRGGVDVFAIAPHASSHQIIGQAHYAVGQGVFGVLRWNSIGNSFCASISDGSLRTFRLRMCRRRSHGPSVLDIDIDEAQCSRSSLQDEGVTAAAD